MADAQMPSMEQILAAAQVTKEQLQAQEADLITGALNDLVSGRNPLKSKTLLVNGTLFAVGLGGSVFTIWSTGDVQQVAPFLVLVTTSAVNTVLRFFTTGPILTQAMTKLMGAYTTAQPK